MNRDGAPLIIFRSKLTNPSVPPGSNGSTNRYILVQGGGEWGLGGNSSSPWRKIFTFSFTSRRLNHLKAVNKHIFTAISF